MADDPGARFAYSSGAVHLLSAIVRETAGKNASAFAREHLFGPLGITDVGWPLDRQGLDNHGWGDLRLRPHDMAKIGYLYLHEGQWDGQQVLSPAWVAAATANHVSTLRPTHDGYGYLWWIRSAGGYAAVGRGSQRIHVLPDKDMVVVITAGAGGRDERQLEELVPGFILPAVQSTGPLPPNPDGAPSLEATVRRAAQPQAQAKPVPAMPRMARRVSGKTYALEANPYGLTDLVLTFDGETEARFRLSLTSASGENAVLELPVGLDDVFRLAPGRGGSPAATKGFWKDEHLFVLEFDEIGNINRWRLSLTFEKDEVAVLMREGTGLGKTRFAGRMEP